MPQKSRSHLNLMPGVKQFAIRNGYEADDADLELTFRAFFIGGMFALINAAVNMFFAFRYAGGLAQCVAMAVAVAVAVVVGAAWPWRFGWLVGWLVLRLWLWLLCVCVWRGVCVCVRACVLLLFCFVGRLDLIDGVRRMTGRYWVILVSYPIAKATEKLPPGLLNPGA